MELNLRSALARRRARARRLLGHGVMLHEGFADAPRALDDVALVVINREPDAQPVAAHVGHHAARREARVDLGGALGLEHEELPAIAVRDWHDQVALAERQVPAFSELAHERRLKRLGALVDLARRDALALEPAH